MGVSFNDREAGDFNSFIDEFDLEDIKLGGFKFARVSSNGCQQSKIDRFLVSSSCCERIQNLEAIVLPNKVADHRPILLRLKQNDFGPIPFKFYNYWLDLNGFDTMMEDIFKGSMEIVGDNACIRFKERLQYVKKCLKEWNRKRRKEDTDVIMGLHNRLEKIEIEMESGTNVAVLNQEKMTIIHDINKIELIKNREVVQKIKQKWVMEGDENSKFFHSYLKKRRRMLAIRGIKVNGVWIEEPEEIKQAFFEFHAKRFSLDSPRACSLPVMKLPKICDSVFAGSLDLLSRRPSIGEVREVIWSCGINKAPGPDGFSFGFIKRWWPKLQEDILAFVGEFFEKAVLPRGCNTSFITLIPKVDNPCIIADYRPISLINVQYKIISKLLANRLSLVVDKLVHPTQSAFISGRQILDGPLMLNEVITWVKSKKKRMLVFKVDFAKAFDSIRWDYLFHVLRLMGFNDHWVNLIRACLVSASSSILVNGSPTKEFKVEKGLRQGDPLSPFLFILAMEGLNFLINEEIKTGNFKPMLVGHKRVSLSHLFYADDAIFIGEWSQNNMGCIISVLHRFKELSGLHINLSKSRLFGWGIKAELVSGLASTYGCAAGGANFTYLGVPLGINMKYKTAWDPIIVKFKSRLAKWKANLLSIGGRLTLVKSVLGSISTYYLSLFRLPKNVNAILEGLRAKFFWGIDETKKRMHWVDWDLILANKKVGGLGVGSLKALNQALLLKWKWRFLSNKDQPWAKIVDSIYYVDPLLAKPSGQVGIWSSICKSSNFLHDNDIVPYSVFKRVVGRGDNTSFWSDIWLGDSSLASLFPRLFALEVRKECKVSDRLEIGGRCWEWRRDIRGGVEAMQLNGLNMFLDSHILGSVNDCWKWDLEGNNDFVVKHIRGVIERRSLPSIILETRWNKMVPKKVNICVWRLLMDRLPVRNKLVEKYIPVPSLGCLLCDCRLETSAHIFSSCPVFASLWKDIGKWLLVDLPVATSPSQMIIGIENLNISKRKKLFVEGILFCAWWLVWKRRNDVLHKHDDLHSPYLLDSVWRFSYSWFRARDKKFSLSTFHFIQNPLMYM